MSATRSFGPFLNIPHELIKRAGFGCRVCHKPVERFVQVVPYGVVRMVFHACRCGCVVVWEDEAQVTRRAWQSLVMLMKNRGVDVVMINGNKPLEESFSGVN